MSESSELSLTFYGLDAKECEDFIRVVRRYASKNHKVNDDPWIAEQIYPCFGGKALRWYMKQPREVRDGWELLQQALLQEWSAEQERESILPINPTTFPFPLKNLKFTVACLFGYNMAGVEGAASGGSLIRSQTPSMNTTAQQFEVVPLDGGYGLRSVAAPQFYASAVQHKRASEGDAVQLDASPYPWKIYPAGYPNSFVICNVKGTRCWDQWGLSKDRPNVNIILHRHNSPPSTNQAWSFIAAYPQ